MSTSGGSRLRWMLLLAAMAGGCSENPVTEFGWRENTLKLIPAARTAVQQTLADNFGKPTDLVAWDRLPVEYGGVKGQVIASADGAAPTAGKLTVQFTGDASLIRPGDPVIWQSGTLAKGTDAEATVAAFDATSGVLTLKTTATAAPAVDDKLAVGYGRTLQFGRVVYMKNCHHCHGVAGDGLGPTAKYLNPKPRDYRDGIFKFTSTIGGVKASRADLKRIVLEGIPGTYMPSFLLIGEKEAHAVVEYVRWLAMRGELEKSLAAELGTDFSQTGITKEYDEDRTEYEAELKSGEKPEPPKPLAERLEKAAKEFADFGEDYADAVDTNADAIAEYWEQAENEDVIVTPTVPRVADDAASRDRGRLIFLSDRGKCYTCHGVQGRGDGPAGEEFWAKPGSNEKYDVRGLHDIWGNHLPPRDLTRGVYRGGRRPLDVFRRIYVGIKGTPMPAFGVTVLKDEEIWDVVNYTMSLPYPSDAAGGKQLTAGK